MPQFRNNLTDIPVISSRVKCSDPYLFQMDEDLPSDYEKDELDDEEVKELLDPRVSENRKRSNQKKREALAQKQKIQPVDKSVVLDDSYKAYIYREVPDVTVPVDDEIKVMYAVTVDPRTGGQVKVIRPEMLDPEAHGNLIEFNPASQSDQVAPFHKNTGVQRGFNPQTISSIAVVPTPVKVMPPLAHFSSASVSTETRQAELNANIAEVPTSSSASNSCMPIINREFLKLSAALKNILLAKQNNLKKEYSSGWKMSLNNSSLTTPKVQAITESMAQLDVCQSMFQLEQFALAITKNTEIISHRANCCFFRFGKTDLEHQLNEFYQQHFLDEARVVQSALMSQTRQVV
jgi:hypothetical protein